MTLVARGLSFSYGGGGGAPVFRGVSLDVEPGERLAVEAPSGAGKTTLCRVLAGYLAPTAGEVLVDGEALADRRRGPAPVQLLWQQPELAFDPHLRLRRSLAEAGDVRGPFARELMGRLGASAAWLDRLPHELSGGELMRLSIVRALMTRPRYLIADEATAMLDALTQARVWHALMDLQGEMGFGMVVVSHSPSLLDRVATRRTALAQLGNP